MATYVLWIFTEHIINDIAVLCTNARLMRALLAGIDRIHGNSKGNVDVIFLDFAKAFNKVPHWRLLAKFME